MDAAEAGGQDLGDLVAALAVGEAIGGELQYLGDLGRVEHGFAHAPEPAPTAKTVGAKGFDPEMHDPDAEPSITFMAEHLKANGVPDTTENMQEAVAGFTEARDAHHKESSMTNTKFAGLKRFLDYAQSHDGVWFPRRIDIARHWAATHPHRRFERPSQMDRARFVERFGGIFEHSPWIAERAWDLELGPAHDSAVGLHNALARMFRSASEPERLGVLTAHPDLAGKLALAKRLTAESTAEQASAGLDALTDAERTEFTALNDAYVARHGFPFIIAVRDYDKAGILDAFRRRIDNDRDTEFAEAARQVERIAALRLSAILP